MPTLQLATCKLDDLDETMRGACPWKPARMNAERG